MTGTINAERVAHSKKTLALPISLCLLCEHFGTHYAQHPPLNPLPRGDFDSVHPSEFPSREGPGVGQSALLQIFTSRKLIGKG